MTSQLPPVPAGEAILSAARRFSAAHGRKLRVGEVEWQYVRLGERPPVLWLTGGLRRAGLGWGTTSLGGLRAATRWWRRITRP